jgi:hypothetical protein
MPQTHIPGVYLHCNNYYYDDDDLRVRNEAPIAPQLASSAPQLARTAPGHCAISVPHERASSERVRACGPILCRFPKKPHNYPINEI